MNRTRDNLALVFAMVFPGIMSWVYFIVLPAVDDEGAATQPNRWLSVVMGLGKTIQFAFPLAYVVCFERARLRPVRPTGHGMVEGLAFGLATALAIIGLYFAILRESGVFEDTGRKAYRWLGETSLNTPGRYLGLAVFYALVHSLMEEYYWRWFVFDMLRRRMSWGWAAIVSGLAFTAHHVVLLYFYLPGYFWSAAIPFALGVAIGGAIWAWIYQRSESLVAIWVSHCLVDMALMTVGYELLRGHWQATG